MSEVRRSPGFWALTLGAVGGACGFFGPMLLNPEANQGPMLGIFITGPGGAIAGFLLGFLFRILPFTDTIRTQALTLFATLLGVGTLWFSLPEPVVTTRLVDGTIARCQPAADLLADRISHWEGRIAAVTYAPPRENWRADTRRMLRESPGVVVELRVARGNAILEHRRPWNRGNLTAQGWQRVSEMRRYFGGGSCESYPRGREVLLAPTGEGSGKWPPDDLPNFLGLQVLGPVPAAYAKLVTRS